jgi:hypothetical protein
MSALNPYSATFPSKAEIVLTAEGNSFRTVIWYPPEIPERMCLFVPSGRVGACDAAGQENELYTLIGDRMIDRRYAVARFDVPLRSGPQVAEQEERDCRTARLREILEWVAAEETIRSVVIFATSLGAETVLSLSSDSASRFALIRKLILIGCVIDKPIFLSGAITSVDLVYGSMDHISYVGAQGGETPLIAPAVFGSLSADRLIKRSSQTCRLHIWDGLGHTLGSYSRLDQTDTARRLSELIDDSTEV